MGDVELTRDFECVECGQRYSSGCGLSRHLLGRHGLEYRGRGRRPIPVPDDELSGRLQQLRRGQRSRHPGRRRGRPRHVGTVPVGPPASDGSSIITVPVGEVMDVEQPVVSLDTQPAVDEPTDGPSDVPAVAPESPLLAAASIAIDDFDESLEDIGIDDLGSIVTAELPSELSPELIVTYVRALSSTSPSVILNVLAEPFDLSELQRSVLRRQIEVAIHAERRLVEVLLTVIRGVRPGDEMHAECIDLIRSIISDVLARPIVD